MQFSAAVFSFLLAVLSTTAGAQPTPILQPLQKPAARWFVLPQKSILFLKAVKDSGEQLPLQSRLPLNYYSNHLGAACKLELRLEKETKLPLRIRLGSKDQVDFLEGKHSRY